MPGNGFMDRKGDRSVNYQGVGMVVTSYRNNADIDIMFDDGTILYNVNYSNFRRGKIKNPMTPSVYNKGFIGIGSYTSSDEAYSVWIDMLRRCYDANTLKKFPSYKDCSVSEELLNFQCFADFYHKNQWADGLKLTPDKDILCHMDNKIYSRNTILFVPMRINNLFTKAEKRRGKYPIGVHYSKRDNKFVASYSIYTNTKKTKHNIGLFETPQEAFCAYKNFKEKYIKQMADEYKDKYPNFPRKLYEAMYNYEVSIND